jgi:hypothetical protein
MTKLLSILIVLCISCNQNSATKVDMPAVDTAISLNDSVTNENEEISDSTKFQNSPFTLIKDFPKIIDTGLFIDELKANCHFFDRQSKIETINYFKKIKLYGSENEYYLIEYDYKSWAMCAFPWKYQILFDKSGKLIKILSCITIDTARIFEKESPFLFGLSSTAKGNGWHEVYRINKDTLEQVYDEFLGNRPLTYSTGYDNDINEPNELYHQFSDINHDGYNDIVFYGKVRYSKIDLGYRDKTIPVKYIFIYHPKTRHFTEVEDYSKKYEFIYGDTK